MLRFFRVPIIILNGLCKWFAVPLSATQAPVTGLTDILTPVNLLPNSDFSRSGGLPSTTTIASLTNGKSALIAESFALVASGANFTNITVNRSTKSLTISGTIDVADGTWHTRLVLQSVNTILNAGTTYTFLTRIKDDANNIISVSTQQSSSGSTIYASEGSNTDTIIIANPAISTITNTTIIPIEGTNVTFSFTLCDLAVYEGEFKNPPVTTSLDISLSKQFALADHSNLYYTHFARTASLPVNKWTRVAFLGTKTSNVWSVFTINITGNVSSNYNNFVTFYISAVRLDRSLFIEVDHKFKGYYVDNTTTGGLNSISKVRISNDSNNNVFFEVYSNSSSVSNYMIHIEQKLLYPTYAATMNTIYNGNKNLESFYGTDGTGDMLQYEQQSIIMTYS